MRAADPRNISVHIETELRGRGPIRIDALLPNSNFSDTEIVDAATELARDGQVILCEGVALDAIEWERIRQRAVDLIDREHATKPHLEGLALTDLRSALSELCPATIETVVAQLCKEGFVRHGSVLARASHRPSLPGPLERSAKQILAALLEKPLDPPARARIATDVSRQAAVRYLLEHGEIVDLGPDLLLAGEAFSRAREAVVQFISANGSATVSQLRAELQTSRRIAVPLLERLDRERVTRRVGDRRVLSDPRRTISSNS